MQNIPTFSSYMYNIMSASRLPSILYYIQRLLLQEKVVFNQQNADGRINSCMDENTVLTFLQSQLLPEQIRIPKKRMWYDVLLHDEEAGWIPVNIKTTTTTTSDNTGNLAMCVQAYTDEIMEFDINETDTIIKPYTNGKMSEILMRKLQERSYNRRENKDYYFLVLNKCVPEDIIINSVLGLSVLTPNINNLPFQICWAKNREYVPKPIEKNIQMFLECLKKPKPSWKELFLTEIRKIKEEEEKIEEEKIEEEKIEEKEK